MKNELVKQDVNFLENPIWFQDEGLANQKQDGYVWKDKEGYIYRAGYKPPVKTDYVFLMYLLLKSQQNNWSDRLELTRYEIIKNSGLQVKQDWYKRLEDSLERWKMVGIKFEGSFYDGKSYQTLNFGIIDDWGINEETKKIELRLNEKWLLRVKNSTFFKLLDFDHIKKLRSPLVIRLYEILIKSFQGRSEWQIDAIKLAQKIPLGRKYASDIRVKIEPAVRRIYKETALKVTVQSVRYGRGKILFIFNKKSDEDKSIDLLDDAASKSSATSSPERSELLSLKISTNQAQFLIDTYPIEQIRRNIQLTRSKASNGEVKNIPAFLLEAIKADYAKTYQPIDQSTLKHFNNAKKCWKKNQNSCPAIWANHKDNKTSDCHYCFKFEKQRNAI
jgi:hypothetical protein